MRIIVVGLGEEGQHLTRLLAQWGHEIIAIDSNQERCREEQEQLDGLVLTGNGSDPELLRQAKADQADLLCAVTGSDEVNLVVSLLAKKSGVRRVIARLRDTSWLTRKDASPADFGVDVPVHPEWETAHEIIRLLKRAAATEVLEFSDGNIQLVGVKLDRSSPWLHKSLQEITSSQDIPQFRLAAILRGTQTVVPTGQTRLMRGDQIFLIARTQDMSKILSLAGKSEEKISRIMILGGGRIGRILAHLLEKQTDVQVKLIEASEEKSLQIATELHRTMVIHADGRDIDVLAQEGIGDTHAYIAATGDDETNIISSLLAKHLGVQKTITLIGRAEYLPLMAPIGLDSAVNIHTIAANTIMRLIRKGAVVSAATLPSLDAEALEYVVAEKAPITRKPLKDISFPKGAILGAVTQNGQAFVPVGDTQVEAGSKVVVFSVPEVVAKVENLLT